LAKRLTRRKVPLLLVYEILFVFYLWHYFPYYLSIPNWRFSLVVGVVSLGFLMYFERCKQIPFFFVEPQSAGTYTKHVALSTIALFGIGIAGSLLRRVFPTLQTMILPSPALIVMYFHIGIYEESMKVAITNILAWPERKLRRNNQRRIMMVVASGLISITIWTYAHVISRGYGTIESLTVFLVGIAIFVIIFRTHNFLPPTLAHILYDIVARD
jgi:hypothetical protein